MFRIINSGCFETIQEELQSVPVLEVWATGPNLPDTNVVKIDRNFWLWCNSIGAACIDCDTLQIFSYPSQAISADKYIFFLNHEWLPMVFQICGTQVLHASALYHRDTNRVIAFCGDSGSGKSTFGFGFSKQNNWNQISDDSLAFRVENGLILLVNIPNQIRLRPESANYFGEKPFDYSDCSSWDGITLSLDTVIFLKPLLQHSMKNNDSFKIDPIDKADTYKLLLKQAFALTTKLPEHNKSLIEDYLKLSNHVEAYQLSYVPGFQNLDIILNALENKILKVS